MSKIEVTLLSQELLKNAEIIQKYGKAASPTDAAISMGAYLYERRVETGVKVITTKYWISDSCKIGAYVVDDSMVSPNFSFESDGVRPVLKSENLKEIIKNAKIVEGIKIVEYGEYPSYVPAIELQKQLEANYQKQALDKTGKSYSEFGEEYVLNGKKYVRKKSQLRGLNYVYSDGNSDWFVWLEVKPIVWFVDKKNNILISNRILLSKRVDSRKDYEGPFETSELYSYLNNVFIKEIEPSKGFEIKKENPYGFDIEDISEEDIIKGAIESDIPVFLHGQSSDGKSARIKQIDPECVIIYLRNATPDSLNGKSAYDANTGKMIDIKPTWLEKLEEKCKKEPEKTHILFLDELTNALPSIQGSAFNIVLDKEVNGKWKLPENVRIVAAGNEMSDSLAANELAEPLFNRFAHVYIETTVEKWLKWASNNHIHPAIYAFIAFRREEVLRSEYDGERPNADPRKWEMASKMLYKTNNPEMLRALVGEEITREFIEFCQIKVITLEDVINGNYSEEDLEMNTAEKYATVMGLLNANEEEYFKVREFINKLGAEYTALFDMMWAGDNEERLEMIAEVKLGGKSL